MAPPNPKTLESDIKTSSDFFWNSMAVKPFLRTFSYREVLTLLTLSLIMLVVIETIGFYADERFILSWSFTIRVITVILVFPAMHVFYRFEHGRSNNFMGRSLVDLLFLIFFYLAKTTYYAIQGQTTSFPFNVKNGSDVLAMFVGLPLVIFGFEILVSLLKYLLRFLRCQIL